MLSETLMITNQLQLQFYLYVLVVIFSLPFVHIICDFRTYDHILISGWLCNMKNVDAYVKMLLNIVHISFLHNIFCFLMFESTLVALVLLGETAAVKSHSLPSMFVAVNDKTDMNVVNCSSNTLMNRQHSRTATYPNRRPS